MDKIRFSEPFITGKEREYLDEVFAIGSFYGAGRFTKRCEELIRQRLDQDVGVLLTDSCTSALEISALLLRDWGRQQSVMLPSYTFSTTASAFLRAGFRLVFCEIDPATMMIDPEDARRRLDDETAAIVAVHYAGQSAEVDTLRGICDAAGIALVEDAAQAFDSFRDGQALGTFGDLASFSFHETKNIHAGMCGALVVRDAALVDRARHIWERGTNRQEVLKGVVNKYSWVEVGGSFYPTELQAAFLLAQLESVEANTAARRRLYQSYVDGLLPLRARGLLHFPDVPPGVRTNGHAFFAVFRSEEECDRVRERLGEQGVAAYIGYVPLHSSRVGRMLGFDASDLPLTEEYATRVLRLPMHNQLTTDDVARVCSAIGAVWSE